MKRLSHNEVEQQITEMYSALADCPVMGPDYDAAWLQATEAERNIRENLRAQDWLDQSAPLLLRVARDTVLQLNRLAPLVDGQARKWIEAMADALDSAVGTADITRWYERHDSIPIATEHSTPC